MSCSSPEECNCWLFLRWHSSSCATTQHHTVEKKTLHGIVSGQYSMTIYLDNYFKAALPLLRWQYIKHIFHRVYTGHTGTSGYEADNSVWQSLTYMYAVSPVLCRYKCLTQAGLILPHVSLSALEKLHSSGVRVWFKLLAVLVAWSSVVIPCKLRNLAILTLQHDTWVLVLANVVMC